MGILDGIVEWVSEQVMNALDLITTSVLGTLGCDMNTFLRFFPAAETMYSIFVATAVGLVLLNWIWQLFKNFGLIAGVEAEDPVKLSIRSVLFIGLIYYCDEITDLVLSIGGTPYDWILTSELPPLSFADFNAVLITILTVISNGSIGIIALILLLILAWNYIKLLFEAAERYILLGVIIYTAPIAFACGASKSTSNIFSSWCRMLAGQVFLLIMNAWCLKLFTSMVGSFLSNPLFFVGGLNETIKEYPDLWHHPLLSYTAICHGSTPGEGTCRWKRAIGCRSIHLVPMRDCFSKGQPENRLLYGISRSQCGTYRWIHDGRTYDCCQGNHFRKIAPWRFLFPRWLHPGRFGTKPGLLFIRRTCRCRRQAYYPECRKYHDRTHIQSNQPENL